VLIFSPASEHAEDPREHYGKLLFELSDAVTMVQGDRRLAMFRAHQHGMAVAEIARRAHAEVAEVQAAIDTLSREPGTDDWSIARWVPRYEG
jgi:hypothetical protein